MRKKYKYLFWIIVCLAILMGCSKEVKTEENEEKISYSQDVFAMDTYMQLLADGSAAEEAVKKSVEEIERLDQLLSSTQNTGEIYQLNENGEGELSEDSVFLMNKAMMLYEDTEGAFNVAIRPVMNAWGFTTDHLQCPEDSVLQEALAHTDLMALDYNKTNGKISLAEGMAIDFGGIAKGYTSDQIVDIYKKYDIKSGLINLGGNVYAIGEKTDGSLWRVAVLDPDNEAEMMGVLSVKDCAVITSGGYERYFEENGMKYHHIIDPDTGYPAENGMISVTIVSEDGTLADGLSTALFVMGPEKAEAYWKLHSETFEAVWITEDRSVYATEGLKEAFTSDYETHWIEKET